MLRVGIGHLLLHLHRVGVNLGGNALFAGCGGIFEAAGRFTLAEIDEEQAHAAGSVGRIKVEAIEHIVDAVCAEGDAHAAKARHAEDAREVVVAAAARDAADGVVEGFHLENATRVVVQAAGEREVELNLVAQRAGGGERVEHESHLVAAFQARLAGGQHLAHRCHLLGIAAFEVDDGLQRLHLLGVEPGGEELLVHLLEAYLVEFVDGYGNVDNLVGRTDDFSNSRENLAVVDFDADADAEAREHLVDDLHQFHLIEQRVRAYYIGVALIKLAVAPFLRAVGTPNGLDLIALEGHLQFLAVLHHVAGEGHGEVVAQAFLAEARGEGRRALFGVVVGGNSVFEVARVQNLK